MTKKLMIREKKLNPKEIVDLVFKKQDWGKTYTIYTCGSITVTCELTRYDFDVNAATFKISAEQIYKSKSYVSSETMMFYVVKDNDVSFQIRLIREVLKRFTGDSWSFDVTIIEGIAKTKSTKTKYDVWQVKEKEISDVGFQEEYDKIQTLSNEDVKESALNSLEHATVSIMNEPYFKELIKIKSLVAKELLDYQKLKTRLNDDLEKLGL